jgi:hypothetical protein
MFSICTLISDPKKYADLFASLEKNNFVNDDDEIITIDNTGSPFLDAFKAIQDFSARSTKKYLLVVHQDVIFNQSRKVLISAINKTKCGDPSAAVFGVAGTSFRRFQGSGHFFQGNVEKCWGFRDGGLVQALDECFLIVENGLGINISPDLRGFHFYGADLCLNARRLGYNSYVIDFSLTHLSTGKLDLGYYEARDRFQTHLNQIGKTSGYTNTTCSVLYGGNNAFLSALAAALSLVMVDREKHPDNKQVLEILSQRNTRQYHPFVCKAALVMARFIFLWHDSYGFVIWKIIFPASWPLRRASSDIRWWVKNWKKRVCLHP